MWKEFKEFAMKGNVIDLAVGVIIGTAFNKIVTSLVNDIVMPLVGFLLGRIKFTDIYISLTGEWYPTLEKAQAEGVPTVNVGVFINTLLDFFIIAFTIFIVVKQMNRLRKIREKKEEQPKAPATKVCGECLSDIPIEAKRCKYCTSVVADQPGA